MKRRSIALDLEGKFDPRNPYNINIDYAALLGKQNPVQTK